VENGKIQTRISRISLTQFTAGMLGKSVSKVILFFVTIWLAEVFLNQIMCLIVSRSQNKI
jgi:hypothetical protein